MIDLTFQLINSFLPFKDMIVDDQAPADDEQGDDDHEIGAENDNDGK